MESRDIRINAGSIIVAILFVLLAFLVWYLRALILIVLAAIVIASAIEPAIVFLSKYRVPRILSVILMYLLILAGIGCILFFVVPPLLTDGATFLKQLPQTLSAFNFNSITRSVLPWKGSSVLSSATILNNISQTINGWTTNLFSTLYAFFGGVTSVALILIFSFYFSVQETGVDDFLRIVTPVKHQAYVLRLWKRSQNKIGKWMQGQLLLAFIVGALLYLGLLVIGLKLDASLYTYALLLAVVAGVCELIPVFGQFLAATPAILAAFATGGITAGLWVTLLYLVIQQVESNIIYPVVVKKVVGLPPLLVILALLIGFNLLGFLGALLAIPVAATLQEFISDVDKDKKRALARMGLAPDGEAK